MSFKLFGHEPSPFVRRVRILMMELGVPFERDANNWQKPSDEFVAASPIKRLPMLDRGPDAKNRYVYDSRVIAETVYAKSGTAFTASGDTPPLQKTLWDPSLEEEDKNVFSALDAGIESAINQMLLENDGITTAQSGYLRRQQTRLQECLAWADQTYAGRTTLAPAAFAFVDMALISAMGWVRFRKRADLSKFPNLLAVEAAHANRRSVIATGIE